MVTMINRSTFALDTQTTQGIKRLAKSWGVSQAEVIRRSVRMAGERKSALSPAEVVAHYASRPALRNVTQTQRLIDSARTLRHSDDKRRAPK